MVSRSTQDHGYDPMFDDEGCCGACLKGTDSCECPPCPTCGQVGVLDCRLHGHVIPDAIRSLKDFALEVDAAHPTSESIARRLYKATECGICCYFPPDTFPLTVTLAGYCEGDVGDCEPHTLVAPFTKERLWEAVKQADQDGIDLWNDTHEGCPLRGLLRL